MRELQRRGDLALREERWQDAADVFRTLLAAARVADDPAVAKYLLNLGLAEEGLGDRVRAREAYLDVVRRSGGATDARLALLRTIAIDATSRTGTSLGAAAAAVLARTDLDDLDCLTGLGARSLSEIEAGDDSSAMRDIQEGLDLVDRSGLGATGRLPNGAAQLRFALAEVRRVRAERLQLVPLTPDFLTKNRRAVPGVAGRARRLRRRHAGDGPALDGDERVPDRDHVRAAHGDLMAIPPTEQVKTPAQQDLFLR